MESKQGEKKAVDQSSEKKIEEAMKDSPYLQYKDLEDYKRQAYGTEGHLEVKPGRGAGNTEGPTVSGANVASQADVSATEAINKQGVN